jgi:hypothetical protein
MSEMQVNGDRPAIEGLACEALGAVALLEGEVVVEPANVVFLAFGGCWYRLYFDFDTVFWRPSEGGPEAFVAPEIGAGFRVDDLAATLSLHGRRLVRVSERGTVEGAAVDLVFEGEQVLTFACADDVTTYFCDRGLPP